MSNDFDSRTQAEAAIEQAVRSEGPERQRWLEVAQAWLELARRRPETDWALTT